MRSTQSRVLHAIGLFFLAILIHGCGARGVAEYQLYTQAFSAQFEQGEVVLNAVAVAERKLVLQAIKRRKRLEFRPDEAAYFVEAVDPPITGSIRASSKALKSYNDALGALANGEAAEALSNRVGTLVGNIVSAVTAADVVLNGIERIEAANLLASKSKQTLLDVAPIIKQVATIASRQEFRRQLLESYRYMKELLLTLRDGTEVMFMVLERSRVEFGRGPKNPAVPKGAIADVEKDRVLLASWVILIDKTIVAMEAAAAAAMTDIDAVDLAALAESSIELRVLAENVKKLRR